MGAIGKYIDGSGADIILAEYKGFGKNVVRPVLDTHLVHAIRSHYNG